MQVFIRRSIFAPLIGAFAAVSLSAGPARAGGGGADAGSLQMVLTDVCSALTIPCPNLPTVSQLVLEIAALKTAPLELVRAVGGLSPVAVVNAVNPTPSSPLIPPTDAPPVAPLAFISGMTATATQP